MATLTVGQISRSGVEQALAAAAVGGDEFANDGKTFFVVKNANVSTARTVNLDIQKTVDGQDPASRTVSVTANKTFIIGPFPTGIYNDADGMVQVTYSSNADLTVGAFRL